MRGYPMRLDFGEVKVRLSSKPEKSHSFEVTIPRAIVKILKLKKDMKLKVFYDTETKEIILTKTVKS